MNKITYEASKKSFQKEIINLSGKYHTWELFSDFCKIAAISLTQPFAKDQAREDLYLEIINKYNKKEQLILCTLLSHVVLGLEDRLGDFLGECFMDLNLGSKYKGQFFTPYSISKFMAQILDNDNDEFETICEPACGSSGMIIARADALLSKDINYQQKMYVEVTDIDPLCIDMSIIQLSLLHIPAKVIHGDALSLEVFNVYYTPSYHMNYSKIIEKLKQKEINKEIVIKEEEIIEPTFEEQPDILSDSFYSEEQLNIFSSGSLF